MANKRVKWGTCSNCRAKRVQVIKSGSIQVCEDCAKAYISRRGTADSPEPALKT